MKKSSIICITTGFLLVLIGMSALLTLPLVIVKIIDSKLVLSPGNPSYILWRDLPVPILHKFYFYNVTNPREVQTTGAVPHLQQIGPFVYRLNITKSHINFTTSGDSVAFAETINYYFDRQLSTDDLSLTITTLNAPLAIAMALMEPLNPVMRSLAEFLINRLNEPFFVDKSIRELLFDGYPDFLTKMAPILNPKIPYQTSFGWMYNKNSSEDGLFSVNTGKTDINKLNAIQTLNGCPELNYWSDSRCNSITGAKNGELFNPIPSSDKELRFFRTDFCRVWSLVWKRALKSSYGDLSVYRYFPADNTFANFTDYPPNSCYKPMDLFRDYPNSIDSVLNEVRDLAKNDSKIFTLLEDMMFDYEMNGSKSIDKSETGVIVREFPSGVFDLSACHYGAPIYISNPHFLNADPYYLTTVSGLKPNSTAHQSYVDVEPLTGTPVELQLRIQLNAYINPLVDRFKQYRKMPKIHIPVLWQEFTIHITDEFAQDLHWQLTGPSTIATIISSLFVTTGAIILLLVVSKSLVNVLIRHKTNGAVIIDDRAVNSSDTSALISNNTDANDSQSVVIL